MESLIQLRQLTILIFSMIFEIPQWNKSNVGGILHTPIR